MRPDQVLTLCDLADAVLDSDDASAYCKGLKTTPRKLTRLVTAVREDCLEPPFVHVVMRNEEENGRRVFLGVYRTKEAAEAYIKDDIEELEGLYGREDYDVLCPTVEDWPPPEDKQDG